ncbi:hypothetical protein [Aeromicrobium sp. CF3.5]|uniref:hypothetical protein n=1 Tax=Aeromicrobium sp. CF3.5 TaxID=3373078 RepID=UPI003EE71142
MSPEDVRRRIPVIVAVLVLVAVAAVLVQRGQADQVISPFKLATGERSLLMAEAAEDYYEIDVFLDEVCAPSAADVQIRDVELFGVDGALRLTGFDPGTVTTRCGGAQSQQLIARLQRESGESAHADGVIVTYESDGAVEQIRLPVSVTLCRQLSEC